MTRFLLHTGILIAVAAVAAGLVVFLGLFNVSARGGHLPGVSWVLHTTFRNAVELRAPPAEAVPDLSDPDLVALGARHYDAACHMCHAGPGEARTATALSMVPAPPPIRDAVSDWEPRHLFWIVKHGVKMSGMPAWPTRSRDDEVWPVVAFLTRVAGMSLAEYEALVAPPDMPDETAGADAASCASCHGADGRGRGNAQVPRLDGLGEAYIAATLAAYRSGARQSGIMRHAASTLDATDDARLAGFYAARRPSPAPTSEPSGDRERIVLGRSLAMGSPARRDVPACNACHGPWPDRRSALFPSLSGQPEPYLLRQLELWRDGERGGTARAHLMHQAARDLDDGELRALAAFYASLDPGTDP